MAANARILCVEDDEDTCEMLTLLLEPAGYEVIAVHTIADALSRATGGDIHLYLIDNLLPDGSGLDLCKQIRSFDLHTPIIFYSGDAFEREIEEAWQAGAQAYLVKPVDPVELERTIAQFLG